MVATHEYLFFLSLSLYFLIKLLNMIQLIPRKINKMKIILHFKFFRIFTFFVTLVCLGCEDTQSNEEEKKEETKLVPFGVNQFHYNGYAPLKDKPINVHTYLPDSIRTDLPVMFVMHGASRNPKDYCFAWVSHAKAYQFITICPDFTDAMYPGSEQYNLGGMQNNGVWQDSSRWAFNYIESIFEYLRTEKVTTAESYGLYGHSAGSQFVHRLSLFTEPKHASIIIPANAGWYTTTEIDIGFPYGLKDSPITIDQLKTKFQLPIVILLGENDTDPNHSSLRKTEEAMRQGKHRFERGHYFFNTAKTIADSLGVDFNWTIETVPGVSHSNSGMAPAAAKQFYNKYKN